MEKSVILKGWFWALFSVLVFWGLNNVMIGYCAKVLHVNYLVYTCCGFISASLMLLSIGGLKDDLAKETLRSPDTFIFGVIMFGVVMLVGYLLTLSLFYHTSSTEGAFLQRISMVFSIMVAWLFMQREPNKLGILGSLCVIYGVGVICNNVQEESRGIVYLVMFLEGISLTGRMFAAESHKTYKKAFRVKEDPKLKVRVVGFVMFAVSLVFLSVSFFLAWIQTYYPVFENSSIVPVLSDFYDYKSVFAGLIAGILFMTPLRLIEFYSSNVIKSENFLAIAAFSPFATLFWEWVFSPLTGLSVSSISYDSLIAGGIITLGCLIVALGQILRIKKYGAEVWREYIRKYEKDDSHVYHSKDVVQKAINHYDGNLLEAAKSLGIRLSVIDKIINNDNYGFKNSEASRIMANFKENIAQVDHLTKIRNRSGFEAISKRFIDKKEHFCIMFIDLDKFKPVNDTYGHDSGDFVLKVIAERLSSLETEDIIACRLAGDEFVVLFRCYLKENIIPYLHKFEELIQEKVKLESGAEVEVGASIGVAEFGEDGISLDSLLDSADKNMYKHKKSK